MSFPDISELIPQQGPARWLSQVLAFEPPRLSCLGRLPISAGLPQAETPSGVLGLELLAQAAAAYGALAEPHEAGQNGLIVSVSRLELHEPHVPNHVALRIDVVEKGRIGRASQFEGSISLDGVRWVEGEFMVVLTPRSHLDPIAGAASSRAARRSSS